MAIYTIQNVGTLRYLKTVGDTTNVTSSTTFSLTGTTEDNLDDTAKWITIGGLTSAKTFLMSYNNADFGLNAYRVSDPFIGNLHKVYQNETDAYITIKAIGSKYLQYQIKLTNYDRYLTMTGSGTNWSLTWAPYTGNDNQCWFFYMVNNGPAICPVTYSTISRGFMNVSDSTYKHLGVDFVNASGTPIKAVQDGEVIYTQDWKGTTSGLDSMGNAVYIQHPNGDLSIYMHMLEKPSTSGYVSVGSTVTQGQQIGKIGNTGYSTGAHLHLGYKTGVEFTSNAYNEGVWLDPLKYIR